jgi:hypothetical protein
MGALELALALVVEAAMICILVAVVDMFKNSDK